VASRRYGTVHGGPDRATGDPRVVNEISVHGSPDEIAPRLEALRDVGVGYVLFNSGGAHGRTSLRRFARDITPRFAAVAPQRIAV
jgi:alkanesulfonate monooxygenase SsuD/methylene tetrahydromethanopterin reductase-like flavin-dependent oxidoreductase (luciferase family)